MSSCVIGKFGFCYVLLIF